MQSNVISTVSSVAAQAIRRLRLDLLIWLSAAAQAMNLIFCSSAFRCSAMSFIRGSDKYADMFYLYSRKKLMFCNDFLISKPSLRAFEWFGIFGQHHAISGKYLG